MLKENDILCKETDKIEKDMTRIINEFTKSFRSFEGTENRNERPTFQEVLRQFMQWELKMNNVDWEKIERYFKEN